MKKQLFALLATLALLLAGCGAPAQVDGEGLEVHFLDVGQADCALVLCDGKAMLIDGGNREDSQLVVSYLQQQGVQELEAVVCSHAHEDHVGGLPGVLAVYPTAAVYAPTRTYASKVFEDFLYYTDQQGLEVIIPAPGDTIALGQAQITILASGNYGAGAGKVLRRDQRHLPDPASGLRGKLLPVHRRSGAGGRN